MEADQKKEIQHKDANSNLLSLLALEKREIDSLEELERKVKEMESEVVEIGMEVKMAEERIEEIKKQ